VSGRVWREVTFGRWVLALGIDPYVWAVGFNAGHAVRHCFRAVVDLGPFYVLLMRYYRTDAK
jgi:hypothetical protein